MGIAAYLAKRRFEKALAESLRHTERGEGDCARAALVRALSDADLAFGGAGVDVAAVHYALAAARLEAGELDVALEHGRAAAVAMRSNVPPPDAKSPAGEEARTLNVRIAALIAATLERSGAPVPEIEAALGEWSAAARRAGDDEAVGAAENQLGLALGRQARREEASGHFLSALQHRTRAFGADGLPTLETLHNAATFRDASRSIDVVGADLERVVKALQDRTGTRERELLESCLHNLAVLREEQQDMVAAETLFERSLSLREERLGPTHRALRPTLVRLAQLHHREGRIVHAIGLYDRALRLAREELSEGHPIVVALEAWKTELTEGVGPGALRRN